MQILYKFLLPALAFGLLFIQGCDSGSLSTDISSSTVESLSSSQVLSSVTHALSSELLSSKESSTTPSSSNGSSTIALSNGHNSVQQSSTSVSNSSISYSSSSEEISSEPVSFMDYLPQHLSHLDTYTWGNVQRGVLIRYRNNPPFPSEAVKIIAENCMFIHFEDELTQSSREAFTIPYPNRIYRFAYKNLTRHYAGTDSLFTEAPEWFMHEAGGSPNIYIDTYPYYNLRDTSTEYSGKNLHEWWVADMRTQIDSAVPGNTLFVDALGGTMRIGQGTLGGSVARYDYLGNDIGEDPYYNNSYTEKYLRPLLARIRDAFADEMIITGNFIKPWFLPDGNYSYVNDYIHSSYIENFERFGEDYTEHLNTGIALYIASSEDGKMTYFNFHPEKPTPAPTLTIEQMRTKASYAMPEFYSSLPDQTEKDDLAEMYAYFDFKLAVFLLGANEYSYFGYQSTVIGDDAGDRLFRAIPPFPEFKYPLGAPLGAAVQDGDTWTRNFEHATVVLDAAKGIATVNWGND